MDPCTPSVRLWRQWPNLGPGLRCEVAAPTKNHFVIKDPAFIIRFERSYNSTRRPFESLFQVE